ncbi:DUF1501 domain-containing protein [Catenuloplanes indicus]|uniref:DUF1501 domain-containing protein n=1 Tax=Catenuloplanes indicus TaxID=137267 RepID=UPI0027D910BE|nr:DUF1501 domain-containing protein [Catenuloplanes indicus]
MDVVTRRRFLLASGVAGGAALAAGAAGLSLAELLRTADREPSPTSGGPAKVVLVTLYGGNDGLNTVIPYADPGYWAARPELAYQPEEVLRLDDALGLNPMLTGLRRMWDDKRLAIMLGVGYPRPDRSHFRSMDIWQTASPAEPVSTGWVGRWLDGTNAPLEAAVSFESVLPPLLVGRSRIGACVSYRGLTLPSWVNADLVTALGRAEPGEPELQRHAAASYGDLVTMAQVLQETDHPGTTADATLDAPTAATGTGGGNALAAQLALVTRCIEAGVPTQVYSVSLGGFDTHAEERTGHEALLKQLDDALTTFVAAMARTPAGQDVTVVVYSEFGRRVRANASDGTDHGTAGPVFALGPRVVGGLYGEQPSLVDLDDGDLKASTDFRAVFGTVLASVLQADPAQYIDGYRGSLLPFIAPA